MVVLTLVVAPAITFSMRFNQSNSGMTDIF